MKADVAGCSGEQRVVAPLADARAGVDLGSALTNENGASGDDLTRERLHPEPLGLGVASVPGGTSTLLVCHSKPSVSNGWLGPLTPTLLSSPALVAPG